MHSVDEVAVPEAPAIPGVRFRRFRGPSDFPAMLAVIAACAAAGDVEGVPTLEEFASSYAHLTGCDPYRDLLLAEIGDAVAGYARGRSWDEPASGRLYGIGGYVAPAWRRRGLGRALLAWMEQHLRAGATGAALLQVAAAEHQAGAHALLQAAGYAPARFFYHMQRSLLDPLPDFPLPPGLELRPALPAHYGAIWASVVETSQDEWGYTPPAPGDYEAWLDDERRFQPALWQIAWDVATDQVAGHLLAYVDRAENEQLARLRGHTEGLGVGRPWRRRGLARALIARSLAAQRALGLAETTLVADSASPSGATRLYEACGFRVARRDTVYRKELTG